MGKRLLLVALSLGLLTHGVIMYFTLTQTYDAYVHIFFADHYSRFWFEPWEYRWYTGFLTISYPPLVHQAVALLGKVFPFKVAFAIYGTIVFEGLIIGVYRFTKIFYDKRTAGVAAILTVILSSLVETLHVYGQVPTLTGLALLLNSIPFLYQYIKKSDFRYLILSLAFIGVVVSSHHVTAIFGMVFFIAPTMLMALVDGSADLAKRPLLGSFIPQLLVQAWKKKKEILLFGILAIFFTITLIFPYWYWSRTDPISQVPIPHGSRDNFMEVTSSGLIFYVIPLLLIFALLPAISWLITRHKRHLGWAVSFYLCLLLGSGGTTPLPRMMLGETAFNILTLDRFGFWASIIAIPYLSHFILSFISGDVRQYWVRKFGETSHFLLSGLSGLSYFLFIIYIFHLASFRPLQPSEVKIEPILNFLNRDDHMRWRYLTLGFGDQMAWLSANTLAASIDGNYHSARRLPEMTSKAVERLENAKYLYEEGMASLTDFLTDSEKYQLKYIFSNDRYYDPLLFYTGWNRTVQLENGIMVWEKGNISTVQPVQPTELHPVLKLVWGIFPFSTVAIAFLLTLLYLFQFKKTQEELISEEVIPDYPKPVIYFSSWLPFMIFSGFLVIRVYELLLVNEQKDPGTAIYTFYDHLDFQRFEDAFKFFKPSPDYSLDQYLLEKSVKDGGLLPSFAKLDQLKLDTLSWEESSASFLVHSRWRTSLGPRESKEKMELEKINGSWYILPPKLNLEIPEEQVISYSYTLFKKMGKRVISSFPTVKDDRVKKPFAAFYQANLVQVDSTLSLTGELINADNIPINISLKAYLKFNNDSTVIVYPEKEMHYNLAPKALTYFKIGLGKISAEELLSIELEAETDVTERGYIRGISTAFEVLEEAAESYHLEVSIANPLSVEITIPGVMMSERDSLGRVLNVEIGVHPASIRSGLAKTFQLEFPRLGSKAKVLEDFPVSLRINGQNRLLVNKSWNQDYPIQILPHSFISPEIYLQ
ncbi:glycosyltransferase family 39 protein [Algoriphagus mannitolivorans]|uniref:glycosyltransferase family 39 protein n=1 Tax=Algoriphagus mannitolivorans TaxID=226504 RepID=UPI001FDFAD28|nr:glycosyltransferase family 39 protein [Algoriphagus mannitolivorans]